MAAIVSSNFRALNAQAFVTDVTGDKSNVYIGVGKSSPWATLLNTTTDSTPPTPSDTLDAINEARQQLIGLKLVSTTDISHVVPRYDWVAGATFVPWDSTDTAIFDKAFYALTADFKVYKCISAGTGVVSDVPTHTSETITATGDGYYWKYMYTILASDSEKFLTNSYMPVKTLTEETKSTATAASTSSAIVTLSEENPFIQIGQKVTNSTNSVVTGNPTVLSVSGRTVTLSANANAAATGVLTFGAFADTNPLFAQQQSQTLSRAIASNQGIQRLKLTSGGAGYNTDGSAVVITVTGDGTAFAINGGSANVDTGYINASGTFIKDIVVAAGQNITNPGTNYSVAQAVVSGGGSPSAVATFIPIIAPRGRPGFSTASTGGGHGCDPVFELGGFYVAINVQISGTADTQIANSQDFRQISLIKNPLVSNAIPDTPAGALNALRFITYDTGGGTGYATKGALLATAAQSADYVIQNTASPAFKAYIVNVDTTNKRIYYFQNDLTGYVAPTDADMTISTGGVANSGFAMAASSDDIGVAGVAEFDAGSGEVLFLENRDPIQRSTSQIEDVKLIIEF